MEIEDLISDKKLVNFIKDLSKKEYSSRKEYDDMFRILRRKYKIVPSKSKILKIYKELLCRNEIKVNKSFKIYALKKVGKSSSGVTVITVLTSPTPTYTKGNEKVEQTFTCGKDCAYCPNEPEVKLELEVIEINKKIIRVKTDNDIKVIRVVSFLLFKDKKYIVIECSKFSSNEFSILLEEESNFKIGDNLIGVKIAQPRSYLSSEPAVLRANRNKFDAVLQFCDRADVLSLCGHIIDKIEILVLGGTWDHYPLEYQYEYIRDLYYAANTYNNNHRERLSLEEEIKINETTIHRIIGLTLETRPDCITLKQIKKLREFNTTRLQIGVQHIDDDILKHINRGCYLKHTIKSNYLWKQNGGKIDWHLMPDLPGSSFDKDYDMFKKLLSVKKLIKTNKNYFKYELEYPELQADQWKIYPCEVTDWTKIKQWYEEGKYKPYSEDEEKLIKLIIYIKTNMFPWIRLNRIVRDIPNINILGGNKNVNLRQVVLKRMHNEGLICNCIRCREIKEKPKELSELFVREYNGVNGREFFISFESKDNKILYGFLRLRINDNNNDLIYTELKDCSFVRELHVYGQLIKHDKNDTNKTQHSGFGKRLLQKAEEISYQNGIKKVAIISGVGVRQYYNKHGYKLIKNYMIKELNYNVLYLKYYNLINIIIFIFMFLLINKSYYFYKVK
tara:strand:+ start:2081 stop:4102 length:2022 start_codon:yes stop_codon:yes gene_type:complete